MAKKVQISESAVAVSSEEIEHAILLIRGHKVMLDRDLARLYGVETKALNRAVQRNRDRFLADFAFELTPEERNSLRFQFGTLKRGQHCNAPLRNQRNPADPRVRRITSKQL